MSSTKDFVFFIETRPNDYLALKCPKYDKDLTLGDFLDIVSENLKVPREKLKAYNQYKIREKTVLDDSVKIEDMIQMNYLINVSLF